MSLFKFYFIFFEMNQMVNKNSVQIEVNISLCNQTKNTYFTTQFLKMVVAHVFYNFQRGTQMMLLPERGKQTH